MKAEASLKKGEREKMTIDQDTIELAKVAIRERSPSYVGNKLVSQVAMRGDVFNCSPKVSKNKLEEENVKAEMNMHVLQNALE